MSNNHHKIFEGSECPTHQMLQDYLDDKLSAEEKHMVERHLIDCEMCSDEIEGLSLIDDRDNLKMIVSDIKTIPLDRKTRVVPFLSRYRFLTSAAALIVLAAIVLVLQMVIEKDQQALVADNNEVVEAVDTPKGQLGGDKNNLTITQEKSNPKANIEKQESIPPDLIDYDVEDDYEIVVDAEIEDEALTVHVLTEDEVEADVEVDVPTEISTSEIKKKMDDRDMPNDELKEVIVVAEKPEVKASSKGKGKGKGNTVQSKDIKKIPIMEDASTISMYTQTISSKGARRSSGQSIMNKAMEKFKAEKYRSASKLFEDIIASDSANYQAMYYAALSYKELDKKEKSLIFIHKILSEKGNSYYSRAEKLLVDLNN